MNISLRGFSACSAGILVAACILLCGTPVQAQNAAGPSVIPAPPGNAQQNLQQSDQAFDSATGHGLVWDAGRKSWIDKQTGQALGFQGAVAKDGAVIPAPAPTTPKSGAPSQAKQDPNDPERAYNSITGQTLIWNRSLGTWVDTRNQRNVGFQGAYAPGTAAPGGGPGASPALGMMYGAAIAAGSSERKAGNKENSKEGSAEGNKDDHGGGGVTIALVIPVSPLQPGTAPPNPPPVQPSGAILSRIRPGRRQTHRRRPRSRRRRSRSRPRRGPRRLTKPSAVPS